MIFSAAGGVGRGFRTAARGAYGDARGWRTGACLLHIRQTAQGAELLRCGDGGSDLLCGETADQVGGQLGEVFGGAGECLLRGEAVSKREDFRKSCS